MVAGTVYRAQMSLGHDSGLPKDKPTNTFHFATTQVAAIDFDNIRDLLVDYYGTTTGGNGPLMQWFSPVLTTAWELDIVHLTDESPRTPVASYSGNWGAQGNSSALPSEVALCASWAADPQSGVNPQRLKGRTFLGPLGSSAVAATLGRPSAGMLEVVRLTSLRLIEAADASTTWDMVVYSGALAGGPGSGTRANKVTSGWVDNSFDTQRSRGEAPTARVTWALSA